MFNVSLIENDRVTSDNASIYFIGKIKEGVLESEEIGEWVDTYIGVILTFLVITCACSMCGFLIYNRYQMWKTREEISRVVETRIEEVRRFSDSLPSYTIVSGLPSYAEAMEQLRIVKQVYLLREDFTSSKEYPDTSKHDSKTPISVIDLCIDLKDSKES